MVKGVVFFGIIMFILLLIIILVKGELRYSVCILFEMYGVFIFIIVLL